MRGVMPLCGTQTAAYLRLLARGTPREECVANLKHAVCLSAMADAAGVTFLFYEQVSFSPPLECLLKVTRSKSEQAGCRRTWSRVCRGRKITHLNLTECVKQREGVLKLLDKDVFNWAVDNSFLSRFTGRHSAALKRGKKRMGWCNL